MTSNWWEGERKSVRKELLRITSMLATSSLSNEVSGPTARTLGRCWSFRVCLWMTQFCSFCTRRAETGLLAYLKDIDLIWESLLGLFSLMGWSSKMAASKHCEKFFFRCELPNVLRNKSGWCPVYRLMIVFWRLSCAEKEQVENVIKQGFKTFCFKLKEI